MKKMNNPTRMETNKRSLARWAFAVVCLAFLMVGSSALAAPPANDNFANATTISGSNVSQAGTTVDATRESGDPQDVAWPDVGNATRRSPAGDRSVWYLWTAPGSGTFTVKTIGTVQGTSDGLDTQVGIYTGSLGSLTEIASSEDAFDGSNPNFLGNGASQVSFDATGGTQYAIMVNGFDSVAGPFTLTLNEGGGGTTNPPPTGLTLTVNTTGSGTVTKDPNKTSYDTNDVVTLTAVPTGTNTFLGWGGDAAAEGTNNPIQVTMDASKTVTAQFTTTAGGGGGGSNGVTSITVIANGQGKVTPNLNGKNNLRIGKRYRLNAIPGRDAVFAGWEGLPAGADVDGSKVSFLMEPGLTITANFAPNPFTDADVVGTFNGLLFATEGTNGVSQDCSGEFTIRVSKNGKFTGRIIKAGKTLPVSGTILPDGTVTGGKVGRRGEGGTLDLQLDMSNHTDRVTGTLTSSSCVATLEGDRNVFSAKNPTPLQGKYTVVFPRNTNSVNGSGFAIVTVNKNGSVRTSGELADGTRISDSTTISKNGQVPIYIPLYRKNGSLVGWLTLSDTNATGLFSWIKPAGEKVAPEGFETDLEVVGSPFNPANKPSITLSNGILEVGGSDIGEGQVAPVTLSSNGDVDLGGTNNSGFKLKILPTGLLRGNFVNPATQKNTALKGVVLQNVNMAEGYFISSNVPGFFEIREDVIVSTNEIPSTNEVVNIEE